MGGELVSPPKKTYRELFINEFPYYLVCGMTESQYWDGDSTLTIYYRKKDQIERDRENEKLWLQGLYIYDAIQRLAPILRPFTKNTTPESYVEKPYPMTVKDIQKNKDEEINTIKEAQKAKILGWANFVNAKMRERNEQS